MRRGLISCVAMLAFVVAGCGTDEYTVARAHADLRKTGMTDRQATCVLDGLSKHYQQVYIALNTKQVKDAEKQGIKVVDSVNPKAVLLYVRNVFAGVDKVGNDEIAFAQQTVSSCR